VRVLGAGRLRVSPRPHLRHAADRHRHRQARRHAPGPGGGHPGGLAARAFRRRGDEQASLASVRAQCPHLDALASHVTEFAKILTGWRGERLDAWISRASGDDQPDLRSFITGLKRDYQAVLNGLTLPYSSGRVEGNVNRIKMLKRQMYGRARFDLLRKRVLLA
jgi:transposase